MGNNTEPSDPRLDVAVLPGAVVAGNNITFPPGHPLLAGINTVLEWLHAEGPVERTEFWARALGDDDPYTYLAALLLKQDGRLIYESGVPAFVDGRAVERWLVVLAPLVQIEVFHCDGDAVAGRERRLRTRRTQVIQQDRPHNGPRD